MTRWRTQRLLDLDEFADAIEAGHLDAGPELDDLAYQAAADALLAIMAKVGQFRGESRFTTWGRGTLPGYRRSPAGLRSVRRGLRRAAGGDGRRRGLTGRMTGPAARLDLLPEEGEGRARQHGQAAEHVEIALEQPGRAGRMAGPG